MRSPFLRLAQGAFRNARARCYSTQRAAQPTEIRHFTSIGDLTPSELTRLVLNAAALKKTVKERGVPEELNSQLSGRTVAMLFNKLSTRTRVSTEAAVAMMGGHPMFLGKNDIQLGVNETLRDTSKVISSMTSCIVARVGRHEDITKLAQFSSVPVINALSDEFHPLQIIADFLTIYEAFHDRITPGTIVPKDLKVAWIGDSNNVLFDFAIASLKLGVELAVATPGGYEIPKKMLKLIEEKTTADRSPASWTLSQHNKVNRAVHDADILITDTWISMGQEEETEKRLKDFEGFQVTHGLAKRGEAKEDWKFMHCLPRHPEEVDNQTFYSPRSLVFQEAENRLWAAVAVLEAFVVNKGRILDGSEQIP
ncbi:ornithine carbamoyltransferase precursor-like protein [Xylariaceae sp. FL0662B]|nr:ornithine carbamoyltransferase precursor-like protein [Xylariaceae sp. FL0662B]